MEIVLNKTSFLDVPIQVEPMHGVTFSNENKGHKFVVSCMRGGELLTLTGTVTARFMRANNTTILIAGNDYTGIVDGKAVVTLPQDCYNVPGRFQMAIFLTADGATSCIYACVGSVQRTQNGDLIDSGEAVPSLEELLAQIDACEQATADATTAANAVPGLVAETFATNKAYSAGSYVYYNGSLYRFTVDHAAGAWIGSDATVVKLADDVGELKSAIGIQDGRTNLLYGYYNYGYNTPYNLQIESGASKAVAVRRTMTEVTMNGNGTISNAFVCKLNNDVQRASTNSQISSFTNGTVFESGHTYRVTEKKISGTYEYTEDEPIPVVAVYKAGTSSNIGNRITRTANEYCREFVADGSEYMIGLRCQQNSSINNFTVEVTVQDMADQSIYEEFESKIQSVSSDVDNLFPITAKATNAKSIPSGANVDLYITPGNYKVASSTTAEGITGLPGSYAGRLMVITLASETRILQVFIRQDLSAGIYVRYASVVATADPSTATWTDWKRIIVQTVLTNSFTSFLTDNTKAGYYLIPKSQYKVGWINAAGEYSASDTRRICTPDIQIATTDLFLCPREGHRITVRIFDSSGVTVTETIAPSDLSPIKLQSGQKYKFYIRKSGESSETPAATVDEMYDKAMLYNPIQYIEPLAINGDAEHLRADYGLVPFGIFYPGVQSETYNAFNYDTTAAQVYSAFDALVVSHSEYITKSDLGLCSDGVQHIYMYDFNPKQITAGTIIDEIPALFLLCGQHGYEKASVFSAYYLFKHMIENTDENPILNYLRNHFRIICIPVANPYGFDQKQYKNYNGVNLNRNWDTAGWGEEEDEQDPTSRNYAGTSPFSEPETQAIRDAFMAYKDYICLAIDYHTNGSNQPVQMAAINAILFTNRMTPIYNRYKQGVRYHIKDITSHFSKQYNLDIPDNEYCGNATISENHGGLARLWFTDQGKLSCTFETFPCFPDQTSANAYSADVIRASEELIGNYIITQLNYTKGL